jgi:hypothetical protein
MCTIRISKRVQIIKEKEAPVSIFESMRKDPAHREHRRAPEI